MVRVSTLLQRLRCAPTPIGSDGERSAVEAVDGGELLDRLARRSLVICLTGWPRATRAATAQPSGMPSSSSTAGSCRAQDGGDHAAEPLVARRQEDVVANG